MTGSNTAPGPRGSRWLGMAPELQRDQLGTYERLVAEYGDVVRLVVGPRGLRRELYLVTHPDGVQQVLAGDPDGYSKNTPYYDEIAAYLGNGLLTSGGPRWRQQRRTVAPLFSHRRIAGYVDVMAEEAARLADRCGVAAEAGLSIDINAAMVDYTLRTVGRGPLWCRRRRRGTGGPRDVPGAEWAHTPPGPDASTAPPALADACAGSSGRGPAGAVPHRR